jgi:aminopeptidase-like protein
MIGNEILSLAKTLWPIPRSLTGKGVQETLHILKQHLPELKIFEVPSGTKCFDWVVPDEWNISEAYIITPTGEKICDFLINNLNIVGYSEPIERTLNFNELNEHLHSLSDQPDAIPYVTSYYSLRWGFCIKHSERLLLSPIGDYKVVIRGTLAPGKMHYAELIIPGKLKEEILISTYVCHPSLANNELSGPCVTTYVCKWLQNLKKRKYTYRIVFVPETIGSIYYISKNLKDLQKKTKAGFVLTCIGDNRTYSYLESPNANTIADKVAIHALKHKDPNFKTYSFMERGSDERQFASPKVNLPVVSIMRSKYGTYPEYHTSLDNFDLVTAEGLEGGYDVVIKCLEILEKNRIVENVFYCEPQLGKRGLYPTLSTVGHGNQARIRINIIALCDGHNDLLTIANKLNIDFYEVEKVVSLLEINNVLQTPRKSWKTLFL